MSAKPGRKDRGIECPRCRKKVRFDSRFLPFCSERCKMVDLGIWLEEGFRINGEHGHNLKGGE